MRDGPEPNEGDPAPGRPDDRTIREESPGGHEKGCAVHELSICGAIARAVLRHADGRRVRSVGLQIGALRQVVPDTLVFCWSIAAVDPLLEGSVLDVDVVPAEVECAECGTRRTLSRFVLLCPACQGPVSVVSGEELLVVSIDVADPEGADRDGADRDGADRDGADGQGQRPAGRTASEPTAASSATKG